MIIASFIFITLQSTSKLLFLNDINNNIPCSILQSKTGFNEENIDGARITTAPATEAGEDGFIGMIQAQSQHCPRGFPRSGPGSAGMDLEYVDEAEEELFFLSA